MTISTRETIIKAVKTCLEGITVANEFQSTVQLVKRGIQGEESFAGSMPGLALWTMQSTRKDLSRERSERSLVFHVWGYVIVDASSGDYDALDKLVADVEKALMTPAQNAYAMQTYIGDCNTYEGGVEDPIGIFDMEVRIDYDYDHASP